MHVDIRTYLSVSAEPFFDELKQKLQGMSITPDSTVTALSNPVLKQQNAISQCDDETITSESLSSKEGLTLSQGSRSLPRIYNIMTNPSVDDQGGQVWRCVTYVHSFALCYFISKGQVVQLYMSNYICCSESFNLRAPKRKQGLRKQERFYTTPRKTISERPPAPLPVNAETSVEEHKDYATIHYSTMPATRSDRPTTALYDFVKPSLRFSSTPRKMNAEAFKNFGKNLTM